MSGRSRRPVIVFLGNIPRVIVSVRASLSPGWRTRIVTAVPSSPRRRSIDLGQRLALGRDAVDLLDQVLLLDAGTLGGPSLEHLAIWGCRFLFAGAQGDVNPHVAVPLDLLGDLALLRGEQLGVPGDRGEQPLEEGIGLQFPGQTPHLRGAQARPRRGAWPVAPGSSARRLARPVRREPVRPTALNMAAIPERSIS